MSALRMLWQSNQTSAQFRFSCLSPMKNEPKRDLPKSPADPVFLATYLSGACAHYVMVSTFQWKPSWLVTQRDPQNDWTATQNRVNDDVFAQAQFGSVVLVVSAALWERISVYRNSSKS